MGGAFFSSLNPSRPDEQQRSRKGQEETNHPDYWFRIDLIPKELQKKRRVDLRYSPACFPYPSAEDQGTDGSCVVFAMSAAFLCAQRKANWHVLDSKLIDKETVFQRARSMSGVSRHVSRGVTFSEAMKPVEEHAQWYRVGKTVENFCACLQMGYPIVVGFALTKEMQSWQEKHSPSSNQNRRRSGGKVLTAASYVLPGGGGRDSRRSSSRKQQHHKEEEEGYHSVLFVGYDHDFPVAGAGAGAFLVRNSWGKDWGLDGHFYFPYFLLEQGQDEENTTDEEEEVSEARGGLDSREGRIVLDAMIIELRQTENY